VQNTGCPARAIHRSRRVFSGRFRFFSTHCSRDVAVNRLRGDSVCDGLVAIPAVVAVFDEDLEIELLTRVCLEKATPVPLWNHNFAGARVDFDPPVVLRVYSYAISTAVFPDQEVKRGDIRRYDDPGIVRVNSGQPRDRMKLVGLCCRAFGLIVQVIAQYGNRYCYDRKQ